MAINFHNGFALRIGSASFLWNRPTGLCVLNLNGRVWMRYPASMKSHGCHGWYRVFGDNTKRKVFA